MKCQYGKFAKPPINCDRPVIQIITYMGKDRLTESGEIDCFCAIHKIKKFTRANINKGHGFRFLQVANDSTERRH